MSFTGKAPLVIEVRDWLDKAFAKDSMDLSVRYKERYETIRSIVNGTDAQDVVSAEKSLFAPVACNWRIL